MTTIETTGHGTCTEGVSDLVNETLLLMAEGLGPRAALSLRSDIRALASTRVGRIVLASEDRSLAIDFLEDLLRSPGLTSSVSQLPPVRTTYRFEPVPALTITGGTAEHEVPLGAAGLIGHVNRHLIPTGALMVEVAFPSPFLSDFSVTHLPDLHDPAAQCDPLETITPGSVVVFVTSAAQPMSGAVIRFLTAARQRTERLAVVVTGVDTEPLGPKVLAVDEVLLERAGWSRAGVARVFSDHEDAEVLKELGTWLAEFGAEGAGHEILRLVAVSVDRLLVTVRGDGTREREAAEKVRRAEEDLARATREAMGWLPQLGYEFTRLRAEVAELVVGSLTALEQRHDEWIQRDVNDAVKQLPRFLVEDLRALQRRAGEELTARLAVLVHQFLAGSESEFLPGALHPHLMAPEAHRGLVPVAQVRADASNEFFASLGNFGSGRQSITLLSSVVSATAIPVALVGGVIGLGFWRLGKRSREEGLARVQASKWLKVQLAESGRGMRFELDQSLNDAQLLLNLAVRDRHEQLVQEARTALDGARHELAEAVARAQLELDRREQRVQRAERLRDRTRQRLTSGGSYA